MSREKELFKNTVIIAFGTIFPKVASLITLPIITAKLSKLEYGTYDLIATLVSLCLPILTLQIQTAAFRFLIDFDQDQEEKRTIISTMLIFVGVISSLSMVVLYLIFYKIARLTRLLIIIYFLADTLLIVLQQIARGLHKNKLYSISATAVSFINMILVLLIVQVLDTGLNGVILSMGGACCIAAIILIAKLRIWTNISFSSFSFRKLKELISYSWPMIPNSLSNWIMSFSDRLVITGILGIEANAVYSVANKIPNLFTSIQGTFVMAWQENASIASKDNDMAVYYTEMFDSIFRIFFAIMACMIAINPIIFKVLIKGDYEDAYCQTPLLYMALLFSAIASFVGGIYVAVKNTKSIGITTVISAMINLLVNILLINYIGIYAGSISTLVSYLILAIFRMENIKKYIPIRYDYWVIVIGIGILTCMCIFCYKQQYILNLMNVIVAVVASICFNKEIIKQMLRKFRKF